MSIQRKKLKALEDQARSIELKIRGAKKELIKVECPIQWPCDHIANDDNHTGKPLIVERIVVEKDYNFKDSEHYFVAEGVLRKPNGGVSRTKAKWYSNRPEAESIKS